MKKNKFSNNALASVRYRLKLTQYEMGVRLGTSFSMVKSVETGRRHLPLAQLLKLAQMEMELTAQGKRHNTVPGH